MSEYPEIYLASASPRRAELLTQAGVSFEKLICDVDESALANETANELVQRLAVAKASSGWDVAEQIEKPVRPVLGADTIVVLDKDVLGKPADREHAGEMLRRLSGRSHDVMSAVAVYYAQGNNSDHSLKTIMTTTSVEFVSLKEGQIGRYLDTDEPYDKAGGYGIQGSASGFVKSIRGSYTGVVGLPLAETCALLQDLS